MTSDLRKRGDEAGAMNRFRIGVFGLQAAPGTTPDKQLEVALDQAAELGVQVLGGDSRPKFQWGTFKCDLGYWRELHNIAAARGLEIEPFVRSPFDLVGTEGPAARRATIESIQAARTLGGPVMRTAYGDNTLARSRYAARPVAEHLRFLIANLREAARLADSEGVILAIENHCDFYGEEWAQVLETIASDSIRCALDTGNGLTVFCDPMRDAAALTPWAVTTHLKDMCVMENPRPAIGMSPLVPFTMAGCPIGDGIVDLQTIVRNLVDHGPLGHHVPLIVEPSWPAAASDSDLRVRRKELLMANLSGLRRLLGTLGEVDTRFID